MKVDGRHFRSIWLAQDGWSVGAIDQRRLPHEFVIARLETADAAAFTVSLPDAAQHAVVRREPCRTVGAVVLGRRRKDLGDELDGGAPPAGRRAVTIRAGKAITIARR